MKPLLGKKIYGIRLHSFAVPVGAADKLFGNQQELIARDGMRNESISDLGFWIADLKAALMLEVGGSLR